MCDKIILMVFTMLFFLNVLIGYMVVFIMDKVNEYIME